MSDAKTPILVTKDSLYDSAKYFTQIVLPAIGTLYIGLAGFWGFPNPEEVGGSILAIDTFLGVVLHISKNQYEKSDASADGDMNVVTQPDGTRQVQLSLNDDPEAIAGKSKVTFKVNLPK